MEEKKYSAANPESFNMPLPDVPSEGYSRLSNWEAKGSVPMKFREPTITFQQAATLTKNDILADYPWLARAKPKDGTRYPRVPRPVYLRARELHLQGAKSKNADDPWGLGDPYDPVKAKAKYDAYPRRKYNIGYVEYRGPYSGKRRYATVKGYGDYQGRPSYNNCYPKRQRMISGDGDYVTDDRPPVFNNPPQKMVEGSGDYRSFFKGVQNFGKKWIPSGTFSKIGNELFGAPGRTMGKGLASLVGFGDYKVKSNSLMPDLGGDVPSTGYEGIDMGLLPPIINNEGRGVRLQRREYIGDILAPTPTTTFTVNSFPINPGLSGTFPWLSNLAVNFEQYRLHGCLFEFRTMSSDTVASTIGMGSIVLATDYDAVDANFNNKQKMESSAYSMSAKPSQTVLHPIECAKAETIMNGLLFNRQGGVPSGKDARFYDLGNFQIAAVGLPSGAAGTAIGELWVTYDVEFFKPVLNDIVSADHYKLPSTITDVSTTGLYFGATASSLAPEVGSNLGTTLSSATVTMPANRTGTFMLLYQAKGAASTLTNRIVFSVGSNILALALWDVADASTVVCAPSAGAATDGFQCGVLTFKYIASSTTGNTISITAGTVPGTIVGGDLYITQLNASIVT